MTISLPLRATRASSAVAHLVLVRPMDARRILAIILLGAAVSSAHSAALDPLVSRDVRVATHLSEIDGGALATLKIHFN